jgi:hypothetical protein
MKLKLHSSSAALALVFSICCLGASAFAQGNPGATGTWKWTFPGAPMGRSTAVTLTLSQKGNQLTGRISRPGEERPIEQGKIVGDQISFQVTWHRVRRGSVTIYNGTLKGDTITGTMTSDWSSSRTRTIKWYARRIK